MARRALNTAGEQSEAGFQAAVIGLARIYGWRIYHAPDNRPAGRTGRPQRTGTPEGAGFPDLVLTRQDRLIFAELKTRTGRLGPGQQDWLTALGYIGDEHAPAVEVYLWRPDDWPDIQRVLGHGQAYRPELDPLDRPEL